MDGPWQPTACGEVVSQHLGKCVSAFVCMCECASACVSVFVTLTPFCPRLLREGTLMGGGGWWTGASPVIAAGSAADLWLKGCMYSEPVPFTILSFHL